MKPQAIIPLFGLAAFALAVPTVSSAQSRWSVSIGSGYGYSDYGDRYRSRHEAQHDELDEQHDDIHDQLDEEHAQAHEDGLSRWDHRQVHRELRQEHRYGHREMNREHSWEHRRNSWQRRYRVYDYNGY